MSSEFRERPSEKNHCRHFWSNQSRRCTCESSPLYLFSMSIFSFVCSSIVNFVLSECSSGSSGQCCCCCRSSYAGIVASQSVLSAPLMSWCTVEMKRKTRANANKEEKGQSRVPGTLDSLRCWCWCTAGACAQSLCEHLIRTTINQAVFAQIDPHCLIRMLPNQIPIVES